MEGPPRDPGRREPFRPPDVRDASQLRVSDEDRHKVAEVLRQAAGEGRIDLEELDQRLEATYQAKTYGDLVPLTVDLPGGAQSVPRVPAAPAGLTGARFASSVAVMSETRRSGHWVLEDGHTAFALMGSVVLDLRDALVQQGHVTVNASALMGEVLLIVSAATVVLVEGYGVMGDYSELRPKVPYAPEAGAPVVRVRGLALMGAVHVQRRGRPGEGRRRISRAR